jgi:hypothetical protein
VCKARSLLFEGLNSGGFYHWAGIKENALTINIIIVPDFKKWTTGQHILDNNAGKQLFYAAIDVYN